MSKKAIPGAGNIPVTIDGEELVLRPTMEACTALSRVAGGLGGLQQKLQAVDFDTIHLIVTYGLGYKPPGPRELQAKIYRSGLLNMVKPCSDFVTIVWNGGQPLADEDAGDGPPPPASA